MGQLGIVEQTGHGVPEIVSKYGKDAFRITDNNIIVTLKFAFNPSFVSAKKTAFTPSQKKVYQAISNDPHILTNALAVQVGLGVSRINVILKELKEMGAITRIGSKKSGYCKVMDRL